MPTPTLWQVCLVSFLGGCVGILFILPLRHHFMVENHGIFPWPEATATAEILVTGEKAGNQAKELAVAAGIGALYDSLTSIFRLMGENITLKTVWVGTALRERFLAFNFLNNAATMGIGYIIGLRYSAVMAAGSIFSMFVLVPLFHAIGQHVPLIIAPGTKLIADMSPEQVFFAYIRIIGVGAIATIGTNPISGMTMLTLVITGALMLKLHFSGGFGMFLTMMVGGIVCTALAASGAFSTDLKIGHWIGATPARQIGWKFVGTFVAALFTGIAMWLLANQKLPDGAYAIGTNALPAPQASAMKAILEGIFGTVSMPLRWYAFGLGIMLSIVLRMVELPALGFALGMYLPIELNTPLFLGGLMSYWVNRPKKGTSEADAKARENRGVLIASGLMAGGAIMGVIAAGVKAKDAWREGFPVLSEAQATGALGEWIGLIALISLTLYVVVYSRRAKGEA